MANYNPLHFDLLRAAAPAIFKRDPAEVLRSRLSHGALTQWATLKYIDASNRYVFTAIDGGLYWVRWKLNLHASGFWTMDDTDIYKALKAWPNTDGGNTFSGTWTHDAYVGALNDTRSYCKIPGNYVQFTVSGRREIYLTHIKRNISGYVAVTINGFSALVNGPEIVTVGSDRCVNSYNASTIENYWTLLASGLDPAQSYTVRLTVIANIPPGSSDIWFYFTGFGIPCEKWSETDILARDDVEVLDISATDWGYVTSYTPTGASASEYTGGDHGNEAISSVQWLDGEGNNIAVSAGTPVKEAPKVRLLQSGYARHSETGATNHAEVDSNFEFTYQGVRQTSHHRWLSNASLLVAYIGGMVGNNALEKGHLAGMGSTVLVLSNDDMSEKGQKRSRATALWSAAHGFVLWSYLPNLVGVNYWLDSIRYTFIRDEPAINKGYYERVTPTAGASLAINDVWDSDVLFQVSYKPGFLP